MDSRALKYDWPTTRTGAAGRRETVLLVDDEDLIRRLEKESLSMMGYEVLTAATGREAVEIYSQHKDQIDLVVLDLSMPEMDGHTCIRELVNIDPHVSVIVTSGSSDCDTVHNTMKAGAKGFIRKPFGIKEFRGTVRKILTESRIQ